MKQADYTDHGFKIKLAFCKTHNYPAMEYEDGSVGCWWEELGNFRETNDHQLIPLAWT